LISENLVGGISTQNVKIRIRKE